MLRQDIIVTIYNNVQLGNWAYLIVLITDLVWICTAAGGLVLGRSSALVGAHGRPWALMSGLTQDRRRWWKFQQDRRSFTKSAPACTSDFVTERRRRSGWVLPSAQERRCRRSWVSARERRRRRSWAAKHKMSGQQQDERRRRPSWAPAERSRILRVWCGKSLPHNAYALLGSYNAYALLGPHNVGQGKSGSPHELISECSEQFMQPNN